MFSRYYRCIILPHSTIVYSTSIPLRMMYRGIVLILEGFTSIALPLYTLGIPYIVYSTSIPSISLERRDFLCTLTIVTRDSFLCMCVCVYVHCPSISTIHYIPYIPYIYPIYPIGLGLRVRYTLYPYIPIYPRYLLYTLYTLYTLYLLGIPYIPSVQENSVF